MARRLRFHHNPLQLPLLSSCKQSGSEIVECKLVLTHCPVWRLWTLSWSTGCSCIPGWRMASCTPGARSGPPAASGRRPLQPRPQLCHFWSCSAAFLHTVGHLSTVDSPGKRGTSSVILLLDNISYDSWFLYMSPCISSQRYSQLLTLGFPGQEVFETLPTFASFRHNFAKKWFRLSQNWTSEFCIDLQKSKNFQKSVFLQNAFKNIEKICNYFDLSSMIF